MSLLTSIDRAADIHARLEAAEAALAAIGQRLSPAVAELDIAILIPCRNHASTIGEVVKAFRTALPNSRVYVYDNNSHDNTSSVAREAGAIVRREPLHGDHHVIRRMFSDVEADVYVMVAADGSYDAAAAPRLVTRLIETSADMVVAARITEDKAAYRSPRKFGDELLARLAGRLLADRSTDMLSGYRAFSRRFVKSFPALERGIGTSLDLAVHAATLGMVTSEIQAPCFLRPESPATRLQSLGDCARTLSTVARLARHERPMMLFGVLSAGLLGATALAAPWAAGAAAAFGSLAALGLAVGLVLESVCHGRRESHRLAYNSHESLTAKLERLEDTRSRLSEARAGARAERARFDLTRSVDPRRLASN